MPFCDRYTHPQGFPWIKIDYAFTTNSENISAFICIQSNPKRLVCAAFLDYILAPLQLLDLW